MKTWQEIDIPSHWFDYGEVYDAALALVPDNGVIVEVGSWLGKSTCYLGTRLREQNRGIRMYAVDKCVGPYEDAYMDPVVTQHAGNIAGGLYGNILACELQDFVVPIIGTGNQAALLFPDESLDFAWIDAAHDYASVLNDLRIWWPKVRRGGVFGGHDYNFVDWPEVTQAVHEFFPEEVRESVRFNFIPHPKCWSCVKP